MGNWDKRIAILSGTTQFVCRESFSQRSPRQFSAGSALKSFTAENAEGAEKSSGPFALNSNA
jgi:hypothetical protein